MAMQAAGDVQATRCNHRLGLTATTSHVAMVQRAGSERQQHNLYLQRLPTAKC
jgi:hypothetical protein